MAFNCLVCSEGNCDRCESHIQRAAKYLQSDPDTISEAVEFREINEELLKHDLTPIFSPIMREIREGLKKKNKINLERILFSFFSSTDSWLKSKNPQLRKNGAPTYDDLNLFLPLMKYLSKLCQHHRIDEPSYINDFFAMYGRSVAKGESQFKVGSRYEFESKFESYLTSLAAEKMKEGGLRIIDQESIRTFLLLKRIDEDRLRTKCQKKKQKEDGGLTLQSFQEQRKSGEEILNRILYRPKLVDFAYLVDLQGLLSL